MGLLSALSGAVDVGAITYWSTVLLAIYFGGYAVYNLFFSPIAHVPGPVLARISGIPSYYHAVKGDRHIWLWQLHQIYGAKVRVTPYDVVFLSPQAHRDIYGQKSNVMRAKNYEFWQRDHMDVNTLNTSDNAIHHRKRRILNAVFTEKSVKAAEYFIQKHVDRWDDLLVDGDGREWSEPKNLSNWADYLVFDILCDLCFGRSLDVKEPGENRFRNIPHGIHEYMKFTYPFTRSPLLPVLLWLKPRGLNAFFKIVTPPDIKAYFDFIVESVTARRQSEIDAEKLEKEGQATRQDMFHFLFQAKNPETGELAYQQQELFAEANLLVIAGSDTTSINLSGFFFYMTRHPRAVERLVQELRDTFASAEEIVGGARLASCKYLRACIDESMRLTPAGPSELSRTILDGGITIDGEVFPAGITVGTSGWSSGRSELFGDPDNFRPERWIVDEKAGVSAEEVARISTLVHPFSAGWSSCVGKSLAMTEMLTVFARTLYRLEVRLAPGDSTGEGHPDLGWGRRNKNHFQLFDAYTSMRDGPIVQFRRRAA